MPRITFLEVDEEDTAAVLNKFPDAATHAGIPDEEQIIDACKDAEAVSCFVNSRFSKKVIGALPALKLIVTRSVGYDHIDIGACRERGITVCNVPDYGSHVIAEHVFALLLGTLRHVSEGDRKVKGGTFDYHGLRGMALRGKTMGIVGTGKIGRRVAEIANGFSMEILASDQCRTLDLPDRLRLQYVSLPDLLHASDIISLHVPETPETHHMIDASAFASMKKGVVLVNTARGGLIDSAALLAALEEGKVQYALLDVLEHELNFAENKALLSHPRVVATPHIAFYADDSMRNMYLEALKSIDEWLTGSTPEHIIHPLNVVCDMPAIRKS